MKVDDLKWFTYRTSDCVFDFDHLKQTKVDESYSDMPPCLLVAMVAEVVVNPQAAMLKWRATVLTDSGGGDLEMPYL